MGGEGSSWCEVEARLRLNCPTYVTSSLIMYM